MTTVVEKEAPLRPPSPATYADWRAVVERELKGVPLEKRLTTATPEGIQVPPLYPPRAVARLILPEMAVEPADGSRRIWQREFGPEAGGFSPLPALAAALEHADTSAHGSDAALAADPLGWLVAHGSLPMPWEDCLADLALGVAEAEAAGVSGPIIAIGADGWHEAGATAVQELAFALATGAEYWRALLARNARVPSIRARTRLQFAVGVDFYMEIAKLRAARLLWAKAAAAFGAGRADRGIFIAARTAAGDKTIYDPHVNLLRITTQALAAVVGGADALNIRPFDEVSGQPSELASRLSRNLHEILAAEFALDRQFDPAAGAWHLEDLTDQLARRAWELFQDLERRGGMAAAILAGHPQRLAAEAAEQKQGQVDTRRRPVLGTTIHPNLREEPRPAAGAAGPESAETPPAAAPIADFAALRAAARHTLLAELTRAWAAGRGPGPAAPALRPFRAAAGFEAVRRAGDDFLVRAGRRARVFLAKMGPAQQHRARAEFSAGFFSAGGFEIAHSTPASTAAEAAAAAIASGAALAVLCSTDDTYPDLAPDFARRIKAAAPAMVVVLAGQPGALEADYRAAGFDEFIHLRANVRTTLARLQRLARILP